MEAHAERIAHHTEHRIRRSDIAPRPSAGPIRPVRPDAQYLRVADETVAQILARVGQVDGMADGRCAYLCACLSAWSYGGGQAMADVAYRLGFGEGAECYALQARNSALFTDTDAFYLRSADGRLGVLAYRGTELDDPTDLLTDIDVIKAPFPEGQGQVHGGFLRALMPLWDAIVALTTDPATRVEHLFITGHSLGGALAAVTAVALGHWGHVALAAPSPGATLHAAGTPVLRGLYTFGQPMVGDEEMAAWAERLLGHLTHRHIYGSDVIPHLPPVSSGRFAHFGSTYRVVAGRFARAEDGGKQSLSALLDVGLGAAGFVARRVLPLPVPLSLGDHMPGNYVRVCRDAVNPLLAFP